MLTYEKVLEIFADYLKEDQTAEAVSTRHGYALMMWDVVGHDWMEVYPCETPGELFDALLEEFTKFHEYKLASSQSLEDYTPEIVAEVKAMCGPYLSKRQEAEKM